MDFALARTNMVKSQLAPNRVHDARILTRFIEVPREEYVAETDRDFAYIDRDLALSASRHMLKPLLASWLLQAMESRAGDRILVVGAGTGYEATVLAGMGMQVFALESDPDLAARGESMTQDANISWRTGELAQGWSEAAPFDGIVLLGSVPEVPNRLISQLASQGRLVAVTGQAGAQVMSACRMVGIPGGDHPETLFETTAPMLPGFGPTQPAFQL